MTAACGLLEAELALDRIEAELATELPAHVRAFAVAHAGGVPVPPAPAVLQRASTLIAVRNALEHPLLVDRARVLERLVVPIAIEDDLRVIAARGRRPTWAALATLARARDDVAGDRFGDGFLATMHRVFGVTNEPAACEWPDPIEGWHAVDGSIDVAAIETRWAAIAARHGASGNVQFVLGGRARTFIVVPQRHVIVVVPSSASPSARFAILHELGHAVAALVAPAGVPRVVDEAAAAYVARTIERPDDPWYSELAAHARRRRVQLASALDAIERGAPAVGANDHVGSTLAGSTMRTVPWALWHDPAAQAAYVEAEAIADRWERDGGSLAAAIDRERRRIDSSTT